MILIRPSFEILRITEDPLELIEYSGRTCYASRDKTTIKSYLKFCQNIIKSGHESVIEHASATVRFIVDRGFLAEITRHRLASFSCESTRYVRHKELTFIIPPWVHIPIGEYTEAVYFESKVECLDSSSKCWFQSCFRDEKFYIRLLESGWTPQQARSVLPNSLKSELIMTANFREWKHIFNLRCSNKAHPQMREIMIPLRDKFRELVPIIFED